MHQGDAVPKVRESAVLREAVLEMTAKKLGMTAVVNESDEVLGIFTDGDLRRLLEISMDLHETKISEVMMRHCTSVDPDCLAAETVRIMEEKSINALLVVAPEGHLVGALNMHDLLRAGVV
jgi:arabinose-5-phosphate isomerase